MYKTVLLAMLGMLGGGALANSTVYLYDDIGQIEQVIFADGSRIVYQHDDVGNRESVAVSVDAALFSSDIGLSMGDSSDPAVVGNAFTVTYTLTNNGPDTASGVSLSSAIVSGTFVIEGITPSQGSCTPGFPLSCALGIIPNGAAANVGVVLRPTVIADIELSGSSSNAETDPVSANDASSETTVVTDSGIPGDMDGDGMPDVWETTYGLNPLDAADAVGDLDGDGLSNVDEFDSGTDPTNPDTDGDGLVDGIDPAPLFHPKFIAPILELLL